MRLITHKVLFLFCILCMTTVTVFAQSTGNGKMSGKIVDAENNEGIPFATAQVLDRKTKASVRIAQSDADGNFLLAGLPNGIYTFKASYMGFQTMVRDSVAITDKTKEVNFGSIKMKMAQANVLNEVTVTATKPTMQMGIDKKIFSVDQSLVSEGGSASDLLQNVPSVQTDIDGNVSLRGSSGVKVLIDGKPSLIAGGDVAQILQSIPASSIETVELITNPSAKYDAEGQSGIINIVLKRNKKLGFNGSVALTAGNRDNYNANTSLSFQNKKINLYGNYSYRYGNRIGGGYNNIEYLNPSANGLAFANQLNDSRNTNKGHNLKAGIDYYLTEKSVLSFSSGVNFRNGDNNTLLDINQLNSSRDPYMLSSRYNDEEQKGNSFDLNLDFTHKFKKPKEELTASLSFSRGNNDNNQIYNTHVYNIGGTETNNLDIQRTTRDGLNRNYNVQLDYSLPLGEVGKIETGYRSQIRQSQNNTLADQWNAQINDYDFSYTLSNDFTSKDQVHALYFNYQNQMGNFGYQLGLRGENARLDTRMGAYTGTTLGYTPGKVAYTRLYPSVYLTEKLNDDQQMQLSYSRRVNRPRGWDTNPFLDVSDPLNLRQGNPNLKPEDVHAFEFSYSKYWKTFSLVSSLYFRQTNDVIQRIRTEPDADGVTLTTPQNLTRNISSGLELIAKYDVVKAWNFTANVNLYQSKIKGVPAFGIVENSGFSWNANLTNNFVLPYAITLQVKGDYRAAEIMAQGKRNAMFGMDAGAKYDFKDKKSSLSLNIRDVFNSRKWKMTTNGTTSIVDFSRRMQGTMANLTYSYRFGKTAFSLDKKAKKQDDQDNRPDEEAF